MLTWKNDAFNLELTGVKHFRENLTVGIFLHFQLTKGVKKKNSFDVLTQDS